MVYAAVVIAKSISLVPRYSWYCLVLKFFDSILTKQQSPVLVVKELTASEVSNYNYFESKPPNEEIWCIMFF